MRKNRWLIVVSASLVLGLALMALTRMASVQSIDYRRKPTLPTITRLPDFPEIPRNATSFTKQQEDDFLRTIVDHKLSTHPVVSSRSYRIGKFTSTGIFDAFEPSEEQVARLAPHYDHVLFGAKRRQLVPLFRKHNPQIKAFIYCDSNLNPGFNLADAGSVDEENTKWVSENHPDWLLRDQSGKPIRASRELTGAYFPDPGNEEWQLFFARKVNKLLEVTGNHWDGALLDDFFGSRATYTGYAGTAMPANYASDETLRAAQLRFLKRVAPLVNVPIVPNIDAISIAADPEFFSRVVEAAGGANNEGLPHESSEVADGSNIGEETYGDYLEVIRKAPKHKYIGINSKPGGVAGDVDRLLYAYYTYLLIAGRDREVYWTFKEGFSDVPHYWFKEFDLDVGNPLGEYRRTGRVYTRGFDNGLVIVNPAKVTQSYELPGKLYDIHGKGVWGRITLPKFSGFLFVKDPSILPR